MRQSYRIHSWLMLLILLLWFNFIIPLIIVEGLQGVVVGGSDEILLSETNDRYKENHERNSLGLDEQRSKTQEAGGAVEASPNVFVNSILSEEDLKIIEAKLITLKREGEFVHPLAAYVSSLIDKKTSKETCSQLKSRIYRNASFEDVSFGIVAFSSLECNQKDMRIPTSVIWTLLESVEHDISIPISSAAASSHNLSVNLIDLPPWIGLYSRVQLLDSLASADQDWKTKRSKLMEDVISFIRSESQTPQDVNGFLFIEMFDLVLTSNTIASTELTNLWNQWFNKTTFLSKVNLYISSSTDYFLFDRLLSIYLFMASQDSTSTSVYELSRILSESMTTAIQNLQEIVRDKSTTSISGKSKSLCLSFLLLRKSAFASGLIVKFNQCFENQICIDVNLCSILPQQEQPISSKQWLQSIGLAAVHSEQPFNTTLLQRDQSTTKSTICNSGFHQRFIVGDSHSRLAGFLIQWTTLSKPQKLWLPSGFIADPNSSLFKSIFPNGSHFESITTEGNLDFDLSESLHQQVIIQTKIADRLAKSVQSPFLSNLTFSVSSSFNSLMRVSLLLQIQQSGQINYESSPALALLNHPFGAPTSQLQHLDCIDRSEQLYQIIIDPNALASALFLTPRSVVTLTLLLSDGRHSIKKQINKSLKFTSTPVNSFNATNVVVVENSNRQYYPATKREAFWHPAPVIRHQFEPARQRPSSIISGFFFISSIFFPLSAFWIGLQRLSILSQITSTSAFLLLFSSCLFFGTTLLAFYWLRLNIIQFFCTATAFVPIAAIIGHRCLSQIRERHLLLTFKTNEMLQGNAVTS